MRAGSVAAGFSPDGSRIVTASEDKTARVWDAASGKELARLAHEDGVQAAGFSPDGSRIVTASDDKTARVWDAVSGRELARLAHEDRVYAAGFSPDGSRIVTASTTRPRGCGTRSAAGSWRGSPMRTGSWRRASARTGPASSPPRRQDRAGVGRGERQGAGEARP